MGTNYYTRHNECPHCNRYDDIHIGKSSWGWDFSFHRIDKYECEWDDNLEIKTRKEWEQYLEDRKIFDEYGKEISIKEFFKMIDEKKTKNGRTHENSIKEYSQGYYDDDDNFFMEGDFC